MRKTGLKLHYLKRPFKIVRALGSRGLLNWMPDKLYLKLIYWGETGKKLNLDRPLTFNEKLQWLKLYDRYPEYRMYVDKYAVRAYVEKVIGGQYLIPMLGLYKGPEDIDWNALPKQFVLKCTHGSHCNIICLDKEMLNIRDANIKLKKWLKKSWYWFGREWPYKNLQGRILCEQLLSDTGYVPYDYKIMCFNGEPKIIQIHRKNINGTHTIDFYDMNGALLFLRKKGFKNSGIDSIDIESLKEMPELAKELSKGTLYLRTDFYLVYGQVYFSELTFTDSSGFIDFEPEENNEFLGEMINLGAES